MIKWILVFIGGGLGSMLRTYLSQANEGSMSLPWGTFITNALACLMLGALLNLYHHGSLSTPSYILLAVGFCGGFSTFSTFSSELSNMLREQAYGPMFIYLTASMVVGILFIILGHKISQLWI